MDGISDIRDEEIYELAKKRDKTLPPVTAISIKLMASITQP